MPRIITDDDFHASLKVGASKSNSASTPSVEGGGVTNPSPSPRDAAAPIPDYAHGKSRSEQGGCS